MSGKSNNSVGDQGQPATFPAVSQSLFFCVLLIIPHQGSRVWVPSPELEWISAEVINDSGDTIQVRTEDDQVQVHDVGVLV